MEQKLRRDRRIGDNLRALRDKHDISQEKLCAMLQTRGCDIARSCYAKYESGELNVRISVLIELKKIYRKPKTASLADYEAAFPDRTNRQFLLNQPHTAQFDRYGCVLGTVPTILPVFLPFQQLRLINRG